MVKSSFALTLFKKIKISGLSSYGNLKILRENILFKREILNGTGT